jgi:protein SPT2
MPIGDLLAQIKGEKSSTPPAARSIASDNKRKAESVLNGHALKAAKTASDNVRATLSTTTERPAVTRPSVIPASSTPRQRQTVLPIKAPATEAGPTQSGTLRDAGPSARVTDRAEASTEKVPKKRSYAEIMQRATIGQQRIGPIGKIQHKPVAQTTSTSVSRDASKPESTRVLQNPGSRKVWKSQARLGNGLQSHRDSPNGRNSRGSSSDRQTKPARSRGEPTGKPLHGLTHKTGERSAPEPEKKVKKAALATTGYKGTSRPTPGSLTKSAQRTERTNGDRDLPRGAAPKSRYAGVFGGRRSRREEEDEEMDDFIEYDDEEEPQDGYGARQRRYADSEEDESDMEAGFSDMELEDNRASLIARREDQEQEALELKLKREKEERKRKLLQSRR